MSTPAPYVAARSPFDVAAVTAALDRAAGSLKADERLALTVQLDSTHGFGGGLVIRGPFKTSALATLTKPPNGAWGWTVSGRIAFLAGDTEQAVLRLQGPEDSRHVPTVRDLYRLFRAQGAGAGKAAGKAVGVWLGLEVALV